MATKFAPLCVARGVDGRYLDQQLAVEPTALRAANVVTVGVSAICSTPCHEVCRVEGSWVGPTRYHVDFFIQITSDGCLQVLTS